ncbi:MAG: hypothetical protein QOE80_2867 [Actinomycetota bacterium]|jgi:transcriptional regulator with XRE-family HTH domain|nr:hypothetical protein [Actinomycetota bacterium]
MIVHMASSQLGDALLRARLEAGLRQDEVAARADVDQSMISIYERGRRDPSWSTFRRLVHGAGAAAEVRLETLPAGDGKAFTIAELGRQLQETDDRRRRRLVLEFVSRFAATEPTHRVALLLEEPTPVGDSRWDALLGALGEHLAFHDAVDPPQWCTGSNRFLDRPWYWIDLPSVRRRVRLGAPTAFRRRNVWVDRSDLERV